jgi:hypothetical protein
LLGDLRDEVWKLRDRSVPTGSEQEEARTQAMVQALEAQLKEKTEQVATLKGNYQNVVFLLFAFVIGVVSGKMLM